MATHELYLGGPATTNYSRAMFPAPAFSQSAEPFISMEPAAHKGPNSFALNRVLDFGGLPSTAVPSGSDSALKQWEANATVVQGDALGLIIIPKHTLLLGVFVNVANAAGVAMTLTPRIRLPTAALPAVDGNVAAAYIASPGGTAVSATGTAAVVVPYYIGAAPVILEVVLTAWTGFGNLRLEVSALVQDLSSGQP